MSKEAMKLALGKIKSARDCHPNAVDTLLFEAEEILEEALAKPDFWEGYVPEPVKPAQQPVAIVDGDDHGYFAEILPDRNVKVGQLLYASAPAQRTWVGLTVAEMEELTLLVGRMDYTRMLQLAEAKLRSKNEDRN